MIDWILILHFLYGVCSRAWNFMFDVWFIAVPLFAAMVFNILRLIWSVAPSNENRKH